MRPPGARVRQPSGPAELSWHADASWRASTGPGVQGQSGRHEPVPPSGSPGPFERLVHAAASGLFLHQQDGVRTQHSAAQDERGARPAAPSAHWSSELHSPREACRAASGGTRNPCGDVHPCLHELALVSSKPVLGTCPYSRTLEIN